MLEEQCCYVGVFETEDCTILTYLVHCTLLNPKQQIFKINHFSNKTSEIFI